MSANSERLKILLTHPLSISLLICLPLFALNPYSPSKYKIILKESKKILTDTYYKDLDNNGISEKIEVYDNHLVVLESGKLMDVCRFSGKMADANNIHFGDINNDNLNEIIIFINENGFMCCHAYNPKTKQFILKSKKLYKYQLLDGIPDYLISCLEIIDANHDNHNELYASVVTNNPLNNRGMLCYDFKNNILYQSPDNGKSILWFVSFDLDRDGTIEFFCRTFTDKASDDEQFESEKAYLMVFTPRMEYKFPPVAIGSHFSYLDVVPYVEGDIAKIAVLHIDRKDENNSSFLGFYDSQGNLQNKRELAYDETWFAGTFFTPGKTKNKLFILKTDGTVLHTDKTLRLDKKKDLCNVNFEYAIQVMDLDNDKKEEYIYLDKASKYLTISRSGFTNQIRFGAEIDNLYPSLKVFPIYSLHMKPELFIHNRDTGYYYKYSMNPFYYFKYPAYLIVYGFFYVIIWSIEQMQKNRAREKFLIERRIAGLQLNTMKSRIDPHFTLNLINSISYLMQEKETEKSIQLFNKYITLLRNTILSSDQIAITLKEELEFVSNYLALEKHRSENRFDFDIVLDENINLSINIPKMLLQIFVENSIKHGIRHLTKPGLITISGTRENGNYLIFISDNGVGMEQSRKFSHNHTGKGFLYINEILKNYNLINNTLIQYNIINLTKDTTPLGTKIEIIIPHQ